MQAHIRNGLLAITLIQKLNMFFLSSRQNLQLQECKDSTGSLPQLFLIHSMQKEVVISQPISTLSFLSSSIPFFLFFPFKESKWTGEPNRKIRLGKVLSNNICTPSIANRFVIRMKTINKEILYLGLSFGQSCEPSQ